MASVAIVGTLVSLLVPAVQQARESARATACASHLKQLTLALRQYEASKGHLPPGARAAPYNTTGVSWLVELLPYLDAQPVFDAYDRDSLHCGWLTLHAKNRELVNGLTIDVMRCPSSALPTHNRLGFTGTTVMTPSYVGITGAASDNDFAEGRVTPCCHPHLDGEVSAGGVLPPNRAIALRRVTDGATQTLVVSEASATAFTASGHERRIDGGLVAGWVGGARTQGVPPKGSPYYAWNVTTLAYELNRREFDLPGVDDYGGPNNPLVSPHPGVVHASRLDGSVSRLSDRTDLGLLKALATRDDGRYAGK